MAKESNFMVLKRQIREKSIGNLYLFYGEEVYLKEVYLERIGQFVPNDGFEDFNRIILDGKELTPDKINDALESFPMMRDKKLVLIKDSGIFKSAPEDIKTFWTARLKNIPDYVLLIFDEKEVDKRSVLYKAVNKAGFAVEFEYVKDYELVAWVEREAGKAKKKITKENAEYFIRICDPGLSALSRELDKLVHYCGEEIYKTDIDRVVSKSMNIKVFELTDKIIAKDADGAMGMLMDLKTAKEPAFKLLYLLHSSFDKMLRCKLMLAEGAAPAEVAAKAGIAPFLVNKYASAAKHFSEEYLINRLIAVPEADLAIKSGETEDWPALEQYVLNSIREK